MQSFQTFLAESAKSDKYERDISDHINKNIKGVSSERPKASTKYSDILVTLDGGESSWIELKMSHTDNGPNPRIFFDGKKWRTTYTMQSAIKAADLMNKSKQAKLFIKAIAEFSGIKNPKIPTTTGGLKDKDAVPKSVMLEYFSQPGISQYIGSELNVDMGAIYTDHYLNHKAEPAHYLQAGDDFYLIGNMNPLGLKGNIPKLSGKGDFKVRVARLRGNSNFYEVQAELKLMKLEKSKYSVKPGTKQKNPFEGLK